MFIRQIPPNIWFMNDPSVGTLENSKVICPLPLPLSTPLKLFMYVPNGVNDDKIDISNGNSNLED